MKLHARERIRGLPRWLRNRVAPGALILLYHRVADVPLDPHLLAVTPRHFAEHLEVLRKYYRPVSLQELVNTIRGGGSIERSVAVTFDDGYADNLYNAKPLLEKYDIPATVFVATGFIGRAFEGWRGELERLVLRPQVLPQRLDLKVGGQSYQWDLEEAARYSEEDYRKHSGWNYFQSDTPSPRHSLYRSLYAVLCSLPDAERREAINSLLMWAGLEPAADSPERALNPEEICRLTDGRLVEVGSHSVTHTILSTLPASVQRHEIQQCKSVLEELTGGPVMSFAYPYGRTTDYTPETVALVREAGYTSACSAVTDVVRGRADHYQLPRLTVGNPHTRAGFWDGDVLAGVLRWMIGQ